MYWSTRSTEQYIVANCFKWTAIIWIMTLSPLINSSGWHWETPGEERAATQAGFQGEGVGIHNTCYVFCKIRWMLQIWKRDQFIFHVLSHRNRFVFLISLWNMYSFSFGFSHVRDRLRSNFCQRHLKQVHAACDTGCVTLLLNCLATNILGFLYSPNHSFLK